MSESRVTIEGMYNAGTYGATTNPLPTTQVVDPNVKGIYTYSTAGIAGTAAAQTFLTLFNPVGSGKNVFFMAAFTSGSASGAASSSAAIRGYRIAAAPTGGTVQAVNTVAKFKTSYVDPIAELRLGNPTVTLGAAMWNTPPIVTNGAGGGSFVHVVDVQPASGGFLLAPGEGIAINRSAGDTTLTWNFTVVWAEV